MRAEKPEFRRVIFVSDERGIKNRPVIHSVKPRDSKENDDEFLSQFILPLDHSSKSNKENDKNVLSAKILKNIGTFQFEDHGKVISKKYNSAENNKINFKK